MFTNFRNPHGGIQEKGEEKMGLKTKNGIIGKSLLAVLVSVSLFGCATDPQVLSMKMSDQKQQQLTVPESTWTDSSSGEQANALAKGIVDTNNNTMKEADKVQDRFNKVDKQIADLNASVAKLQESMNKLQSTEDKTQQVVLQSAAKLEKLEKFASEYGSAETTLFFKTGSTALDSAQHQRLVNFLEYLSRTSYGRKITFMTIGSASATGSKEVDMKLSLGRAKAPLFAIEQYLVNIPHAVKKVVGLGDKAAPKKTSKEVDQRYQSVRIIAVYDEAKLP